MVKIKLAELRDLDRVKEIAEACAKKMIEDNIFQWNEDYPSKEIFREDIKNNALFVARINSEIVGCIMLSSYKDDVYKNIKWISEDNNNLYIHRLAVHPRFQKKGIARKMMDYAEAFAKSKNYKSLRKYRKIFKSKYELNSIIASSLVPGILLSFFQLEIAEG